MVEDFRRELPLIWKHNGQIWFRSTWGTLQMAYFVGCYDNPAKSTRVFDDSHGVDLLEALINNASSSDVGESCAEVWLLQRIH